MTEGKMKRVTAILIILALLVSCVSCADKKNGTDSSQTSQNNQAGQEGDSSTDTTGEKNMTDNTNQMTDEEQDKFAAGASADSSEPADADKNGDSDSAGNTEDTEPAEPEKPVNDGLIEEKCPVTASNARPKVEYGKVTHGTYYSETCGMDRGYNILLPAGYSDEKKYPVLYMLHGIFGDENSFTNDSSNKIKEIVGNLAADGWIDETVVVFPNMYAKTDPAQQPGFTAEACLPYDNFVYDLVNDLMPFIESNYSVLTGRENTALAGFSMGGRETLYCSYMYPEKFAYVCAISPAPGLTPGKDNFMEHPGSITEDELRYAEDAVLPDRLMVCCGTKDSVVGKFPESYHEIFTRNGVEHTWWEIEGADHDNNAIKSGVYNLFKQIGFAQQAAKEAKARHDERMGMIATVLPAKHALSYDGDCGKIEKITYTGHDYLGDGEGAEKNAYVYLPAGYDETKQYNVIYLLHGIGGNEAEWGMDKSASSKVKNIMDNLIGLGIIEPAIVVTPNGRAMGLSNVKGNDLFYKFGYELRNDLIPYIESHYATYASYDENGYDLTATRTHRAVAGLSMGGMQTINIGMCECLDIFSWFGAFSAAPTSYNATKIASVVDDSEYKVDFFYNICGTNDNTAYASASAAAKNLPLFSNSFVTDENFMWMEKGGGHDFNIWYLGFYNFALIAFNE